MHHTFGHCTFMVLPVGRVASLRHVGIFPRSLLYKHSECWARPRGRRVRLPTALSTAFRNFLAVTHATPQWSESHPFLGPKHRACKHGGRRCEAGEAD